MTKPQFEFVVGLGVLIVVLFVGARIARQQVDSQREAINKKFEELDRGNFGSGTAPAEPVRVRGLLLKKLAPKSEQKEQPPSNNMPPVPEPSFAKD